MFAEIAAGGMAAIHVGRLRGPTGFSRTVAIKRLHAQFAKDPEFVEMLLDEANLAARIQHPNVVSPIDVVATRGELFLVMDYVRGESLSRLAAAARLAGTAIPLGITRSILSDVLHGLHAAHEAKSERGNPLGIVHRDVSPQNILVGVDGAARVLDFGIAKAAGRAANTRDGQIKGKIAYMAPECFQFAEVNRQSDIYAAAVVLWETLTGERLFKADTDTQTVARILANEVDPPSRLAPQVSRELDAVVLRGLARDPSMRFETARDMALALEATGRKATAIEVGEWVDRTAHAELAGRERLIAAMDQVGERDLPSEPPDTAMTPTSPRAREMPTSRFAPSEPRRVEPAAPRAIAPRAWPPTWLRKPEARNTKASGDRYRLALFSMDDGEYQELLREDFLDAARGHGFPVRVFRAGNDSQKQVAQIQECLREAPDRRPTVVMISPVREVPLRSIAYEAARLGVGWVLLGRWSDYVNNLRAEFPELPIFAVMADQKEVGRIQGRQIVALLPGAGELVSIQGPLGTSSAVRRHAGVQEVLQGSSIEVFTIHSDWTLGGGTRAMLDWARVFQKRPLPRFIVGAQNDAMAMGARDAVQTLAVERGSSADAVSFCGCDGSPSYGQRLVTEGKLAATVILPASAGRAIAEVASMLRGGPRPPATVFLKPIPFPEPHLLVRSARSVRPSEPTLEVAEAGPGREGTPSRPPGDRKLTGRPSAKGRAT
jgi:serine/threonine protein kinase/ABC-type sugar transport system substrate-binding protein